MAEFESLVKEMNKQKEYKPETLESDNNFVRFWNEWIPWVDKPRLQWDISVDISEDWMTNLQSQITALDWRVTALENP